jgi:hypothetical protein
MNWFAWVVIIGVVGLALLGRVGRFLFRPKQTTPQILATLRAEQNARRQAWIDNGAM